MRRCLIVLLVLIATVISQEFSTQKPEIVKDESTQTEESFFTSAFNFIEKGLRKIFGFKELNGADNSTTIVSSESILIKKLTSTDSTIKLLNADSESTVSPNATVIPESIIKVKEDATTIKSA